MREVCECGGDVIYEDYELVCERCYLVKEPRKESVDEIESFFNNRDRYSSGKIICQGGYWSIEDVTV